MSEKHVVAVSWEGGFALGALSNLSTFTPGLQLFRYRVMKNGRRFALRYVEHYQEGRTKIIWERMLAARTMAQAQKAFRAEDEKLRAADAKRRAEDLAAPPVEPSMTASQMMCLAKAYPETVRLLTGPRCSPEEIFAAYQRETLAVTGHLVGDALPMDKDSFTKAAKLMVKATRRKGPAIDAVDFELIAGCDLRGYKLMKPAARAEALKTIGLGDHTADAIRKRWQRLGLPAVRKRGAPKGKRLQ